MQISESHLKSVSRISSRLYESGEDFPVILNLLSRVRPPQHINDYPVQVNIEEDLASEEVRTNTRLWFDDDRPIAWAYVDGFNNLRWELDPAYEETLGTEVVAWGEVCLRKTLTENEPKTLDASCREDYTRRISFLNRHGFQQTEDTSISMMRRLLEEIPVPVLSQGFVIRPIKGKEEVEAVATTHRAAFGTDYMTTESRLAIMSTREYDPSLDLLVIAPDGSVAAYCTCSANDQTLIGWTDPIATHPNFQHRGLARALLLTGMRMLKERGMEFAKLGTSGANIAMQRTASSVGFHIDSRTLWFTKDVRYLSTSSS